MIEVYGGNFEGTKRVDMGGWELMQDDNCEKCKPVGKFDAVQYIDILCTV